MLLPPPPFFQEAETGRWRTSNRLAEPNDVDELPNPKALSHDVLFRELARGDFNRVLAQATAAHLSDGGAGSGVVKALLKASMKMARAFPSLDDFQAKVRVSVQLKEYVGGVRRTTNRRGVVTGTAAASKDAVERLAAGMDDEVSDIEDYSGWHERDDKDKSLLRGGTRGGAGGRGGGSSHMHGDNNDKFTAATATATATTISTGATTSAPSLAHTHPAYLTLDQAR